MMYSVLFSNVCLSVEWKIRISKRKKKQALSVTFRWVSTLCIDPVVFCEAAEQWWLQSLPHSLTTFNRSENVFPRPQTATVHYWSVEVPRWSLDAQVELLDQLHFSTKSIDCGAPNGNRRYCTISHDGVFRICTELKKVITPIKVK